MRDKLETAYHYAYPAPGTPSWLVYLKRDDEEPVAEWYFLDRGDVRRRMERLDQDAEPTLFD